MRVLIAALPMLGLAGCAAFCPIPQQQARTQPCQTAVSKLQEQDDALKATVNSTAPIESRQGNARTIQGNLQIMVQALPTRCPASIAEPLGAEVKQRIGQIDGYLSTGTWVGPVG